VDEQITNKAEKKVITKPISIKPAACNIKPAPIKLAIDQEKVINQLRQEILTLTKAVQEMQQKQDAQSVIVMIPCKMLQEVNTYLSEASRSMGYNVSLSDLICEALDLYLDAEKDNERLAELRSGNKKK